MSDNFLNKLVKLNKESAIITESSLFNERELIPIDILGLNIAFSGDVDGGMGSGLHFFAAPSKSFKTLFGLITVSAFLKKNPDGIVLFYDTEFGTTLSYWKSANIDMSRVIHIPIRHVESFKFDIVEKLEAIVEENKKNKTKKKVMVLVDSIGNMASLKEVEDAKDEKSVADMSRAKQLKGVFRIVTPYLTLEEIPCVAINHVYSELGLFPKTIMGGGCMVEGSKVQLEDGTLKNIEDFRVGDIVKTLEGPKLVTHTWNPETLEDGTPECYEIEFEDGHKVTVSDEHKFLIDGEWVEAKNLKTGLVCQSL